MKRCLATITCLLACGCLTGCATVPGASRSAQVREINTVRQVEIGCMLFAGDHDGALPTDVAQLRGYLGTLDLRQIELVTKGGNLGALQNPATVQLVRSRCVVGQNQHAVAFADGHAELVVGK